MPGIWQIHVIMMSNKIFPFAPGIPWQVAYGKYIVPEISAEYWHKALRQRTVVVTCFGGLIESFFSLTYLEVLNHLVPSQKLYWDGYGQFAELVTTNGLASVFGQLKPEDLAPFPTPIFLDRNNYVFFNVLSNYLDVYAYYGNWGYRDKKAIFKQLFRNCLVNWDHQYLPKFRINMPQAILDWAKINQFSFDRPYVVIFPDRTGVSVHKNEFLNWNPNQVKALGTLLAQKSINLVVFAKNPGRFYDVFTRVLPIKLAWVNFFISNAMAILSKEIDYLLLGLLISDAALISEPQVHELKLEKNRKFVGRDNLIYTKLDLTPIDVAKEILNL